MKEKHIQSKYGILILCALVALGFIVYGLSHNNFQMLNPKGVVAYQQRKYLITAVLLMLIVVIPVLTAAFVVALKYRAGKNDQDYVEDWQNSKLQFVWWAFPGIIIAALAFLTWRGAHQLDPFKPLDSQTKPMTIEVVALEWKWLFLYPDQNIATINFVEFPQNTPVQFKLTADAPMNSFWIPQLGGQMYAMAGMSTQLNLMASEAGNYDGSAAEINGAGFAGMRFTAKAVTQSDFDTWVKSVQQSSQQLNADAYGSLAQPSRDNPEASYVLTDKNLYNEIIEKYMGPPSVGHIH